jgi:glycosyltransferase involved in cell wall biosynthesis
MYSENNLISIIVPIYGVEKYLAQCIESIISQTYRNLEIILVNDGSKDNCASICDYYASLDERIIVIHKLNGGLVSARKAGMQIAKGEYIGFVDGDDWVESRMYEDLMHYAVEYKVDVVAAGHKEELDGKVVEVLYNNLPCGYYSKDDLVIDLYPKMLCTGVFSQFGVFSYLWNKIFRRDVIFNSQMDVDNRIFMAEDAACTYPTLLIANSVYITDSSCYRYRQRVDSMVKARDIDKSELDRYNFLYKHLYSKFNSSEYAVLLLPQLDLFLLSLLTVRSGLDFDDEGKLNELFAFREIPEGSKILVCGAGTFGQHLVKRIRSGNKFHLVGWVDDLFQIYKNLGLSLESMTQVNKLDYNYVLVALIDERNAENMKNRLLNYRVKSEKILMVSHYLEYPVKDLLKRFGLEIAG